MCRLGCCCGRRSAARSQVQGLSVGVPVWVGGGRRSRARRSQRVGRRTGRARITEEAEVGWRAAELDEPEDGPALEPEPVPSPALFEPVGDGPDVCVVELGPAVGTPVPVDVCVADPSPASVDVAVLVLDDAVTVVVLLWSPLEPSLELVGAAPFAVVVVVAELESSEILGKSQRWSQSCRSAIRCE